MRNLVITENITLDGVVDASEGWFAPSGRRCWKAETRGLSPVSLRHRAYALQREPLTRHSDEDLDCADDRQPRRPGRPGSG